MHSTDIARLDALLQAAQLYRHSEHGHARDRHGELAQEIDADGKKLDAFTVGVLDGLLLSHDTHAGMLPLLVYVLAVAEHGPGRALTASERMLALQRRREFGPFVRLGRYAALRAFAGEPNQPGGYAELLAAEATLN